MTHTSRPSIEIDDNENDKVDKALLSSFHKTEDDKNNKV